jgi:hypothetical protein
MSSQDQVTNNLIHNQFAVVQEAFAQQVFLECDDDSSDDEHPLDAQQEQEQQQQQQQQHGAHLPLDPQQQHLSTDGDDDRRPSVAAVDHDDEIDSGVFFSDDDHDVEYDRNTMKQMIRRSRLPVAHLQHGNVSLRVFVYLYDDSDQNEQNWDKFFSSCFAPPLFMSIIEWKGNVWHLCHCAECCGGDVLA